MNKHHPFEPSERNHRYCGHMNMMRPLGSPDYGTVHMSDTKRVALVDDEKQTAEEWEDSLTWVEPKTTEFLADQRLAQANRDGINDSWYEEPDE